LRVLVVRSLVMALLAAGDSDRRRRQAARLIRSIRRFEFPYGAATHTHLRAHLASHQGRLDEAASLLDRAARRYERAGLPLDAAACRYRRGELVGGAEGAAQRAAAAEELRGRGVVCPERWVPALPSPR
jgi:hypothetical protein